MDVASILRAGSVRFEKQVRSKKHALDILSQMLADAAGTIKVGEILDGLASRERLGSTGLGESVAMPHARLEGIDSTTGALLRLDEAVDFDSPDGRPVDLLFALLVPQDATDKELKELRELVKRLRDPQLQRELRATQDAQALHAVLTDNLTVARRTIKA
jgi:PTS system nitrogen regulatory IIA component